MSLPPHNCVHCGGNILSGSQILDSSFNRSEFRKGKYYSTSYVYPIFYNNSAVLIHVHPYYSIKNASIIGQGLHNALYTVLSTSDLYIVPST